MGLWDDVEEDKHQESTYLTISQNSKSILSGNLVIPNKSF